MKNSLHGPLRSITFSDVSESGQVELQVLRTATVHDPRYGKVHVTKADLDQMVKNFDEGIRGINIMLDAGHNSQAEAYGWFKTLTVKLSEDGKSYGLWAKIDLTPFGQRALTEKLYGYLSADFTHNYQDNETLIKHGPVLLGAALTNRPVIKGMQSAIELSENNMTLEELLAQLGVASTSELIAMVNGMKSKETELSGMPTQLSEATVKLTETEVKLSEAETKLAEAQAEIALSKKENEFTVMLSEGKAVPAQKEAFMKGDIAEFAKNASVVKLITLSEGGKEGTEETAQVQIMKLAEGKMKDNTKLSMIDAIAISLSENKELNEQYKKETQGVL